MPNTPEESEQQEQGLVKYGDYSQEAAQEDEREAGRGSNDMWEAKEGRNRIRMAPPPLGSKSPMVRTYQHFFDLDNGEKCSFNCPRLMLGSFCPIDYLTELLQRLDTQADNDLAYQLSAKIRTFASVLDRNNEQAGLQPYAFGKFLSGKFAGMRGDPELGSNFTNPLTGQDIVLVRKGTGIKTRYQTVALARVASPLAVSENGEPDIDRINEMLSTGPDLKKFARVPTLEQIGERLKGPEGSNGYVLALAERLGVDFEKHFEEGANRFARRTSGTQAPTGSRPAAQNALPPKAEKAMQARRTAEDDMTVPMQTVRATGSKTPVKMTPRVEAAEDDDFPPG